MSNKVTEAIFNSKSNLHNFYPNFDGVKHFDLERKQLLYGRIDRRGDAIYLANVANLAEIYTGGDRTELAIDFVAEAFNDMRGYVRKMDPGLNKKSLLYRRIKVHKAQRAGDLEWSYYQYVNKIYNDFVEKYLMIERRFEKIKNFHDFMQQFLIYISRIVYYFPITRTGYILSHHCSPYISGLMLEIAPELHGVANNKNVLKYVSDPNFVFFVKTAKKFGFMVDKNAPWRLVFNVASGALPNSEDAGVLGAKKYMGNYGIQFENVFEYYYEKAHLAELDNFKNYMFSFYNTFYSQFEAYTKIKYETNSSGECSKIKVKQQQNFREPLFLSAHLPFADAPGHVNVYGSEYWLKIILKLRLLESNTPHNKVNFSNYSKELIRRSRMFGSGAALDYINDLTRGMLKTIFNTEGKYWHGNPKSIYDRRKREAESKVASPDRVPAPLTGVLNKK